MTGWVEARSKNLKDSEVIDFGKRAVKQLGEDFGVTIFIDGKSVPISQARNRRGRKPGSSGHGQMLLGTTAKQTSGSTKKRKPLSPESRAKLAKNLVKARAARAANLKARNTAAKKRTAIRVTKRAPVKTR